MASALIIPVKEDITELRKLLKNASPMMIPRIINFLTGDACRSQEEGAEGYARIESFVLTARKHNKNIFKELKDTFVGQNYLTLQGS